ncbi:MAG: alpha/beta hydrolase [Dehalococcoidia bacterium]|nr:alpha/beta hydrolase [Dehalococcoidia bacterium]
MTGPVTPVDHEVVVNGLRLHYLAWGDPGRPPIVLLHGAFQQAHSWDFVAMRLATDHYVLSLDQRGHGDSEWAPDHDYSPAAYLADLREFTDTLALRRFVLVGLSMGGSHAIRYAAERPERVRGLVVLDIGPQVQQRGATRIMNFVALPDEVDFEEFVQRSHRANPHRSLESYRGSLQHNLRPLPNGKWTWKYDKFLRQRAASGEARPADLWPAARQLRTPMLLIRGDRSDVLSEEDAQAFLAVVPGADYVVAPNAGHLVSSDQPEFVAHTIRHWIATRCPEDA